MSPSELPEHVHLRLPDLRRLLYGEAPEPEAAALTARIEACEGCRDRLGALRAEHEAFVTSARPELESAAILAKLEAAAPPTRWWSRLRSPWVPAMAAAVMLLAVAPFALQPDEPGRTTRLKGGGVGLTMYVKDAEGARPGADGERLREGDQIQFRYAAAGHRHLFVISVDGRGVISPLYPEDPTQSIEVQSDGSHVLEGSVILDDAVGPERIFAVFSAEPVPFVAIDRAVARGLETVPDVTALSKLPLERDDVSQASVLIVKE